MAFNVNAYHRKRYHTLPWLRVKIRSYHDEAAREKSWKKFMVPLRKEDEERAFLEQARPCNQEAVRKALLLALSTLSPRHRVVIELRYGLNNGDGCLLLEEIGRRLGVTRERARQLARDALVKLRKPSILKALERALEEHDATS